MHFSLVRISTPHMPNTRAFDDVLLPVFFALRRLGYQTEIRLNSFNPHSRNICLGANYDPDQKWIKLPGDCIILNLEQLEAAGYPWHKDDRYFRLLAAHECWDFSRRNIDFLAGKGLQARFLPLGYVPEMTRLKACPAPRSDVLFYGAMTLRRRDILDQLRARGLKVDCLTKAYGWARDQALYSTRLFLNIHHSLPASLEVVRLGYVLANSRPVVSELEPGSYLYPELAGACAFCAYDDLVPTVERLLADEEGQRELAGRGFEAFSALSLEEALAELVGRRNTIAHSRAGGPAAPRPNHLRVGSGPGFLNAALNLDTNELYQPDLLLDISGDWEPGGQYRTDRFGTVRLEAGSFQIISVPGLLSRVDDPDRLMKTFLNLLEPGGRLIITVPYDLSTGAAGQRAFNEKSFEKYGSQALLRGWSGAFFEMESLERHLSDYGRVLVAKGKKPDKLGRYPRAVESLRVVLIKRLTREAGAGEWLAATRAIYQGPAPVWSLDQLDKDPDEVDRQCQEPLPSRPRLILKLFKLKLKSWRYGLYVRRKLPGRHGRYQEKLVETQMEMEKLRTWLRLF